MEIKRFANFNKELVTYVSDGYKLTPIMNILMNDYGNDWYAKIGKYFFDKVGKSFLEKDHYKLIERLKKPLIKKDSVYRMIGIYFITTYLSESSLKEMFGQPINHSEFGEGFKPKRKYEFSSYFLEFGDSVVHIGYDERGTIIEVPEDLTPEGVYQILVELVNTYVEFTM